MTFIRPTSDKPFFERWLKRLRDPKSAQFRGHYCNANKTAFCAIGHAAEMAETGYITMHAELCCCDANGSPPHRAECLAVLVPDWNDQDCLTLPEIADRIEESVVFLDEVG